MGSRLNSQYKKIDSAAATSLLDSLTAKAIYRADMYPEKLYNRLPSSAKVCSKYFLRSFVCWGCDVSYVRRSGACVYKKMVRGNFKAVNALLCG